MKLLLLVQLVATLFTSETVVDVNNGHITTVDIEGYRHKYVQEQLTPTKEIEVNDKVLVIWMPAPFEDENEFVDGIVY